MKVGVHYNNSNVDDENVLHMTSCISQAEHFFHSEADALQQDGSCSTLPSSWGICIYLQYILKTTWPGILVEDSVNCIYLHLDISMVESP